MSEQVTVIKSAKAFRKTFCVGAEFFQIRYDGEKPVGVLGPITISSYWQSPMSPQLLVSIVYPNGQRSTVLIDKVVQDGVCTTRKDATVRLENKLREFRTSI